MKQNILKTVLVSFSLLFIFTFLSSVQAEEFELKINDVSGLNSPLPIIASMAFSKGEVKDASSIRIMSGTREVPSQIDITAKWIDGSIRWALAGFTDSPQNRYRVEYGEGIKRIAYPTPLKISNLPDGGFTIDTGVSIYQFDKDKLLPEKAWLTVNNRTISILENSGAGTYLIDNQGRTAKVAGKLAEIENTFLKEGPARVVVKRSGWYITNSGEKLARADVWLYFAEGSSAVRITHSLILTEDTNKVWFKDFGLEFTPPAPPTDVYCAEGLPGEESVIQTKGKEVFLLQDDYPHFAERKYNAGVGTSENGIDKIVKKFDIAGDWSYGDYGNFGIGIVMPWLAERFPKEISFGERSAKAVLWSARSKRELDFRAKTLIDEYWQTWANEGFGAPKDGAETYSNAQGTSLTHDIWFLPQQGSYNAELVKRTCISAARPTLALSDPVKICSSEALGWPSYHKDTKKFPEFEQIFKEYWQRLIMPLEAFPMTGTISWGCLPDVQYTSIKGRIMANFNDSRLKGIMDYGMRRVPFLMYARSGEREYYEYGYKFGRFTGDYGIAHWNSPEKQRGAGLIGARGGLPFFWQGRTTLFAIIDGEIRHWLNQYYLTGDEQSLDLVNMIKEEVSKVRTPRGITSVSRMLLTLSIMDWDEDMCKKSREFIHSIIDLNSQNGLKGGGYGAEYKDERDTYNLLEYYLETGDEIVKEAWLKLLDQKYRFERRGGTLCHRNYDALTYYIAYLITGEQKWRSVVEQTLSDALMYANAYPLEKDLLRMPKNPLDWKSLPPRIFTGYQNPFIGFPAALKLINDIGWSNEPITPIAVKPLEFPETMLLFRHKKGIETNLSVYFRTKNKDAKIEVFPYKKYPTVAPLKGIKTVIEKRMAQNTHYHAFINIPTEKEEGLYILSFGVEDVTWTLLDTTSQKVATFAPDGLWSICRAGHGGSHQGDNRPGEAKPMFFKVPAGLKELDVFIGYPATIKRADGSTALECKNSNIGRFSLPVKGQTGIWSIEPYFREFSGNAPPGFYRFLNIEPIVSFGSPTLLPEETLGKPVVSTSAILFEPKEPLKFVEGVSGKAIRLSSDTKLKFSKGEKVSQGGHTFFPANKGTVEFWFKSNHSLLNTPIVSFQKKDFPFLETSGLKFLHSYWRRGTPGPYSCLQSLLIPDKGNPTTGFQIEHLFRAGKWHHIAYTWDLQEESGELQGELNIFLDGKKESFKSVTYGVAQLKGKQKIKLSENMDEVILGPFEGVMDNLRISDIVRYTEDFIPDKISPKIDSNTRVVFVFEGNLKGISGLTSNLLEAVIQ
jgi:hypothetical protein